MRYFFSNLAIHIQQPGIAGTLQKRAIETWNQQLALSDNYVSNLVLISADRDGLSAFAFTRFNSQSTGFDMSIRIYDQVKAIKK
jgi:hypothetical protein